MKLQDLKTLKTEAAVRAAGKYLQKGRDYTVEDGDIIHFKVNYKVIHPLFLSFTTRVV